MWPRLTKIKRIFWDGFLQSSVLQEVSLLWRYRVRRQLVLITLCKRTIHPFLSHRSPRWSSFANSRFLVFKSPRHRFIMNKELRDTSSFITALVAYIDLQLLLVNVNIWVAVEDRGGMYPILSDVEKLATRRITVRSPCLTLLVSLWTLYRVKSCVNIACEMV